MKLAIFSSVFLLSANLLAGTALQKNSTRADLDTAIKRVREHLFSLSDGYLAGGPIAITATPLKPKLAAIAKTTLGEESFVISKDFVDYVAGLKFDIQEEPCIDGIEEADSSTQALAKALVCLSAGRLARFPASALQQTLTSLLFYNVAVQKGLAAKEAKALQELAELYIFMRPIYLASRRAQLACHLATPDQSAGLPANQQQTVPLHCIRNASLASNYLSNNFRGFSLGASGLTSTEEGILNELHRDLYGPRSFSVETLIGVLDAGPLRAGRCQVCNNHGVDIFWIISKAAEVAERFIAGETATRQDLLEP